VSRSARQGILAGEACVLTGNRSSGNGGSGFVFYGPAILTGNTAWFNTGSGFEEINTGGSSIVNNVSHGNAGGGLVLNASTGYAHNVVSNNGGAQVSGGTAMDGNVCDGLRCP
jgi:hypothetical protein